MDSLSQFLLLIVIVLLQLISRVSLVNLPSGMPQAMYCEGCIATVTELSKKVNKPSLDSREVRVVEALERICDYSNFGSYGYSPPKTAQACNYLLGHFDEEIEEGAIKPHELKDFQEYVCYKLTKACEGLDRESEEYKEQLYKADQEGAIPFGQEPPEMDPMDGEEGEEDEEEGAEDEEEGEEDEGEGEAGKEEPLEEDDEPTEESKQTQDEGKPFSTGGKPGENKKVDDMDYYPPEPEKGELPDNVTPAGDFPGAKQVDRSEL